LSNQKDYPLEVNFANVINTLRDPLTKRGFAIFTRGNPKDQYLRIVKQDQAEIIYRMQITGKGKTRISLVSSKFSNVDKNQQGKFLDDLWQLINAAASPPSTAPAEGRAIQRSPSIEELLRFNVTRFGSVDTEKFAADTGNDPYAVSQVAEKISDGKLLILTNDKKKILTRAKVKDLMLSGMKPANRSASTPQATTQNVVGVSPAPPQQQIGACPNCGKRVTPGALFCSSCGARLK
jgi:hypothetical protein